MNTVASNENHPNSPVSTPKRRKLNPKGLLDKVAAFSPVKVASPKNVSSPTKHFGATPDRKARPMSMVITGTPNTKKRMFSEITQLAEKVQEAEFGAAASREELLKVLAFARERREADVTKLTNAIQKVTAKNAALLKENAELEKRAAELEAKVNAHVDQRFKDYVASQQSSSWYKEFERNMMSGK